MCTFVRLIVWPYCSRCTGFELLWAAVMKVELLVSEIGPHFGALLREQRSGVVASVLASCRQSGTAQREACSLLTQCLHKMDAKGCDAAFGISAKLLTLDTDVRLGEEGRLSPLGCIMLTTVLSFLQVIVLVVASRCGCCLCTYSHSRVPVLVSSL